MSTTTTSARVLQPIGTAGKLFAFGLDVLRGLFRRPFQVREFLQQAWFIASVTIVPTALVSIPFGAVIALQVGGLIKQFGAQSFTGSAAVLAVVREAGPIATSLLIAGAGGSAIAADLGARKIREELDAMMVLGIDPIQRLVVPRVLAAMLVAVFLNGLVSVVGVAGGYVFNVVLQDGTPGAYLASFTALAQLPDLWHGEGARVRHDRGDRRRLQGDERRGRPEGRGGRRERVGGHHLHAPVRRQLRDERDLLPARPTEDRLRPWHSEVRSGRSTSGPCGPWTPSASSWPSTSRRSRGPRARSSTTRRRSCAFSPRWRSGPAPWP
jgi:phospholipid/cholesterol/gamma-HCH transport system permease protein